MDRTVYQGSRVERLPKPLHTPAVAARSLRWLAKDGADRAFGRRDRLTPPARLLGGFGAEPTPSHFQYTGEAGVHYLRELADLKSTDRVLDIGCGIGQTARVLTRELRSPGSYDGFDVNPWAIAWCQKHYRRRTRPPFRFKHADLHNTAYNPGSRSAAADYQFPYSDAVFDLVFAFSLFTHLLPESADRFLSEAGRVLRPGGRMVLTWFLLTDDPPAPAPDRNFFAKVGVAATTNPDNPEAAVAYPEPWLRDRMTANNLTLRAPIHYGSWRGTPSLSYQDTVLIG